MMQAHNQVPPQDSSSGRKAQSNLNLVFVAVALIAGAALLRLVPHPANFSPIAAMALFGGAIFGQKNGLKILAFVAPLAALLLSDLALGFHSQMPVVYLATALVVALGSLALGGQHRSGLKQAVRIGGTSLVGSTLFFVISNLGVWAEGTLYPRTVEGLVSCFALALPFFDNTVIGDLFFVSVLFGAWAWLKAAVPQVKEAYGR